MCRFYQQWTSYSAEDAERADDQDTAPRPGQIDNTSLLLSKDSKDLKSGLVEGKDYVTVGARAWAQLLDWYVCPHVLSNFTATMLSMLSRAGTGVALRFRSLQYVRHLSQPTWVWTRSA